MHAMRSFHDEEKGQLKITSYVASFAVYPRHTAWQLQKRYIAARIVLDVNEFIGKYWIVFSDIVNGLSPCCYRILLCGMEKPLEPALACPVHGPDILWD